MTLPEPVPFPVAIDSSMRASFVECPRSFFWRYLRHLQRPGGSVHLVAGGAFAKGAETVRTEFYDHGKALDEAIVAGVKAATVAYGSFEPPSGSVKTPERIVSALIHYFSTFPPATDHCQPIIRADGKRAIEFKFAVPLDIPHPVTGEPLLYVGRSDMIAEYNGQTFIFDDKTTSQLGSSWPDSWTLRAQLDGYIWAARQSHIDAKGAIVRGISFLKNSFGTAESLQLRSDWQIQRWHDQLIRDIQRMIAQWKEGYWDYNLSSACTSYGGCQFVELCKVPNPDSWIDGYYEVSEWSPLDIIKEQ